jgi:hypothetical protein
MLVPLRGHLASAVTRADLTKALRPWLEKTRDDLVRQGLAFPSERRRLLQ